MPKEKTWSTDNIGDDVYWRDGFGYPGCAGQLVSVGKDKLAVWHDVNCQSWMTFIPIQDAYHTIEEVPDHPPGESDCETA